MCNFCSMYADWKVEGVSSFQILSNSLFSASFSKWTEVPSPPTLSSRQMAFHCFVDKLTVDGYSSSLPPSLYAIFIKPNSQRSEFYLLALHSSRIASNVWLNAFKPTWPPLICFKPILLYHFCKLADEWIINYSCLHEDGLGKRIYICKMEAASPQEQKCHRCRDRVKNICSSTACLRGNSEIF